MNASRMPDHRWADILGFPEVAPRVESVVSRLEPIQRKWQEAAEKDPMAFQEASRRQLRSHAIETGIIERLYDVDWGVTQTLIAEGIAGEAVTRSGGEISADTLDIINDQYQALQFVVEVAQATRPFTWGFIKELHALITQHQLTYEAIDTFGRVVQVPLRHGEWKTAANHVVRPDGSILEYCPAERTQDQMESLMALLAEGKDQHPVVRAAWLHHRFISIHPFQDGNGRVARALVLLVLLSAQYAPLVVSRDLRDRYISHLDSANDGDLGPLITFFTELEEQGMMRQFGTPSQDRVPGGSVLAVAQAAATSLARRQAEAKQLESLKLAYLARQINERISSKFHTLRKELEVSFAEVDPNVKAWISSHGVGESQATYFYAQLVELANKHGFRANMSEGAWWTTLTLALLGERLRLLMAVLKVGPGVTGLAVVVIQAERLFSIDGPDSEEPVHRTGFEWLFEPSELDQVVITGDHDIGSLWADIDDLADKGLSAAITKFTQNLV